MLVTLSLRCLAGSFERKWFAETVADANAWGELLFKRAPFRVVSVPISRDVADSFFQLGRLDNIGAARFAAIEQLPLGQYLFARVGFIAPEAEFELALPH